MSTWRIMTIALAVGAGGAVLVRLLLRAWRLRRSHRLHWSGRQRILGMAVVNDLEPIEDVFGRNLARPLFYSPSIYYNYAPPRSSTLPITIYLSDESVHEQVEAAVEDLLESVGGHIEHRDDPMFGSWFRRMWARVGRATHSPLAHEATILAAHAVESRLVHAQDATVTATMMQNLGPVLTALQPTKDAVIRAGALLVVKVDWVVIVHQLTPEQQLNLAHQPQLAQSPHDILAALEIQTGNSTQPREGLDSATGSMMPRSIGDNPGASHDHVE